MSAAKVIVIDDDTFVRTTLSSSFAGYGIDVVAALSNASAAIEAVERLNVEVALIDLDLGPGPSGIDIAYSLRKIKSDLGLILLTSYTDPRIADPTSLPLPRGTRFVTKTNLNDFRTLVSAVLSARQQPLAPVNSGAADNSQLTDSQLEVLKLVAEGLSNAEIAEIRGVSVKAVDGLIAKTYSQLNLEKSSRLNQRVQMVRAFFALSGKKPPGA